jgi:hypothetical protein
MTGVPTGCGEATDGDSSDTVGLAKLESGVPIATASAVTNSRRFRTLTGFGEFVFFILAISCLHYLWTNLYTPIARIDATRPAS